MPVCPSCGVAYMDGERHACAVGRYGVVARLLPAQWSRRRSLVVFGLAAGLVWALTPYTLYGFRQLDRLVMLAVAGSITGVAMAFAMAMPLRGLGREGTMVVGLFALPTGAFVFGTVLWSVSFLVAVIVPGAMQPSGNPIASGSHTLVGLAWVWPLTLLATPVGMWTTFQLRGVVEARK